MQKKILIVDDEKDALMTLGTRLAAAGYDVIQSDSAKEAITLAKNHHPNLIILDVMMPEMDGAKVADILRHDTQTADIPIIFLTAIATEADEGLVGENLCIAKPYDAGKLLNAVRSKIK